MSKAKLTDRDVKVLRTALRTKLGISAPKKAAKPKAKVEEDVDDEPAPRKQRAERFGYADAVSAKRH